MWTIRRTSSIALRSQTFSAVTSRAAYTEHKISNSIQVNNTKFTDTPRGSQLLNKYCSKTHFHTTSKHFYSSLAGTKINGEEEEDDDDDDDDHDDDLEDGFSELDTIEEKTVVNENENDEELISEPEDEIVPEKTRKQKRAISVLFKAIMDSPTGPVQKSLDKWLEKGESVSRSDVSTAMLEFRRRRIYDKALQLSEWLESRKQLEFTEGDYSSRVDLISKVRGIQPAETYIQKIPKSFKTETVYQTLLANCVHSFNTTKAEQVFNKMKELEFPITPSTCNQLLLLYKRTNKKKIADVLLLMEKENVKLTLFSYRMLVDIKGQSNDIEGMEQIVETMKEDDVEPDSKIKAVLARHYISGGHKEKAKQVLEEMEGTGLKQNRHVCSDLLPLYATLGRVADVTRVWEICKSNPQLEECMAAIDAYGKLKKIEEAESVFNQMSKKYKRISSKQYAAMLKVYANNKMLTKGKDLVKKMAESGCQIGPLTWDALVKLYVEAGEIEKADLILRRASEQNHIKPLFNTYMMILDQYAKKGDVHNAEKMFHRMRQNGYLSRLRQYHSLLQTYINANAPAYGFRERMKADNVFPNKALAGQLAQVDAFKVTAVSDLLD